MSQNVVRLPGTSLAPTAEQMATRIREMANSGEPGRMRFDDPHFQRQMVKRGLNMRQVLETVRKGCPVGVPKLDQWGDWRLKLRRKVAGRRVQVVVALKVDHFVAVTAI
jgi:hypothetical protein